MDVNIVDLCPDDVVLFEIPVGNMPPATVKTYLEAIKKEASFPLDRVVYVAARNKNDYSMTILRKAQQQGESSC